jgi:hypothetical protein
MEEEYFTGANKFLVKQLCVSDLRYYAKLIWIGEKREFPMPTIKFGKGVDGYSWYQDGHIELAPGQRDRLTLAHELTHAMGYGLHNGPFIKQYFKLLTKYFLVSRSDLKRGTSLYKLAKRSCRK